MLDLHLAGIQEVGVGAQLGGAGLGGVAGTGGLVKEHHKYGLVPQACVGDLPSEFQFQIISCVQAGIDFFVGPFLQSDQVLAAHRSYHNISLRFRLID